MYRHIRSHGPQFLRYLLSGGSAAALQLSSYQLMLMADVWYLAASIVSGAIGLTSAFLFHKYFVFKKKENTTSHLIRYFILQGTNAVTQVVLVYLFVELAGIHPLPAQVLSIGVVVSWNYFMYKFFVYV